MNRFITEKMQIVGGFTPVNMASGANTGDYVSLKNYGRCAIVLFKGAGAAGEDPTITMQQASDVSGTGVKNLNFTRIDSKVGTLSALGTFTQNTQAAANTYVDAVSAESEAIMVIDIKAEDLDIANGFDCLRCTIADVGTTSQIGGVLYLLHEPRYGSGTLPSAIAD
jgi:hypothetical protein